MNEYDLPEPTTIEIWKEYWEFPIECRSCQNRINNDFYVVPIYLSYERLLDRAAICSNCYGSMYKVEYGDLSEPEISEPTQEPTQPEPTRAMTQDIQAILDKMQTIKTQPDLPEQYTPSDNIQETTQEISNTEDKDINLGFNSTTPLEKVKDFTIPRQEQIQHFVSLEFEDQDNFINHLVSMYTVSPLVYITRYLRDLARLYELDNLLRLKIIEVLKYGQDEEIVDIITKLVEDYIKIPGQIMSSTNLVDCITFLLKTEVPRDDGTPSKPESFALKLISSSIDIDFRFKTLRKWRDDICPGNLITAWKIILVEECDVWYRVQAATTLWELCKDVREHEYPYLIEWALHIAEDKNRKHLYRAHVVDFVLRNGTKFPEFIERAQKVLQILGKGSLDSYKTFYENKENVHNEMLEECIESTLQVLWKWNIREKTLEELQSLKINPERLEFPCKVNAEGKQCNYQAGLDRILNDHTRFGKNANYTLKGVLFHLWAFIQDHEYREELEQRLIEEIDDMVWTCSSGYISRLINVLTGFEENIGIQIPVGEEFIARFTTLLNQSISRMDIEVLRRYLNDKWKSDKWDSDEAVLEKRDSVNEVVLNQMMIPSSKPMDRMDFLRFLRIIYPTLRLRLYEEYRELMSDDDEFDLQMRKATSFYEGYGQEF